MKRSVLVPHPPQWAGFVAARVPSFGIYDWIVSFPLFVLAATALEISDQPELTGRALLIRSVAALIFALATTAKYRVQPSSLQAPLIAAVCFYFFAINAIDFSYFGVMGTAMIGTGLWIAAALGQQRPDVLDKYLKAYILFNIIGLALAFLLYFATGEIVDLHAMLFPFSASRAGIMLGQLRLSGFQIEPGNYSNYIYCFVLMRALLRRRLFDGLDLVAMLSTLFTLAAWALIGAGAYLLAILVEFVFFNKRVPPAARILLLGVATLVALSALPYLQSLSDHQVAQYFSKRLGSEEEAGSTQFKVEAWNAWLDVLDVRMLLGRPLPASFCEYCVSPQDLGTVLNMMYYLGIFPTIAILRSAIANLIRVASPSLITFICPLVVAKPNFYDFVVWLVIGLLLFASASAAASVQPRPYRRNA